MAVTFDTLNKTFNSLAYPFSNILVTLLRGTATTRVVLPTKPTIIRIVKPVAPVMAKVAKPSQPTYTRVQ